MPPRTALTGFAKAVGWGTAWAASPVLLMTIPIGLLVLVDAKNLQDVATALYLTFLPFAVALPIVFIAMLLIGLPVTLLLSRLGKERADTYLTIGLCAGACLIFIPLLIGGDFVGGGWLVVPGALGGAAAGVNWGTAREKLIKPA